MRNVRSLREYSGSSFASRNSVVVAIPLLYFCFLVGPGARSGKRAHLAQ